MNPPDLGGLTTQTAPSILSEAYITRLERLDRLDRLDARDRDDARTMNAARLQRLAKQEALDAADARDMVALGAEILSELVNKYGQTHLVDAWVDGHDEQGKLRLMRQLQDLHRSCPGGIIGYVERAKKLLERRSLCMHHAYSI